jgi:hypothetical protein
MRARSTAEQSDRLLGHLPRASRAAPSLGDGTGQSCHGLCWSSFRRVGCFFTARRGAPSSSACTCAVRSSPRPSFRGPPSARGFCARLISGDVHSFDPRRIPRAQGVPGTGTRSCIEVRRRHPCRRRPFSVFGRSAPSRSDRFQAVTSVFEDVLTFRTNFLSEVSHRPV